jgi:hypothetical protein
MGTIRSTPKGIKCREENRIAQKLTRTETTMKLSFYQRKGICHREDDHVVKLKIRLCKGCRTVLDLAVFITRSGGISHTCALFLRTNCTV